MLNCLSLFSSFSASNVGFSITVSGTRFEVSVHTQYAGGKGYSAETTGGRVVSEFTHMAVVFNPVEPGSNGQGADSEGRDTHLFEFSLNDFL